MKTTVVATVAMLAGINVFAESMPTPEAIAWQHACFSCHAVDHKVVGPAFKEVAGKYKGDSSALNKLMAKVKNGGFGVWGSIPMPPNPAINDSDLKAMLTWVLAGTPR